MLGSVKKENQNFTTDVEVVSTRVISVLPPPSPQSLSALKRLNVFCAFERVFDTIKGSR